MDANIDYSVHVSNFSFYLKLLTLSVEDISLAVESSYF